MAVQEQSEYNRYRLDPAPPKLALQDYIDRYIETGDDAFLTCFLHAYESTLNAKAKSFQQQYAMSGHFVDLKDAYVLGLLTALQSYKKEKGPFAPYAEYEGERGMHEYIRTMRTGLSVPTDTEYYLLRKAMRLFSEYGQKMDEATIAAIAEAIHREPKTVREMIRSGIENMRVLELDSKTDDEDEPTEVGSLNDEPSALFFQAYQMDEVSEAFRKLTYREREIVSARLGFCPECFSTIDKYGKPRKKQTFEDLMLQFGLSSPATVEKSYQRALEKMRDAQSRL